MGDTCFPSRSQSKWPALFAIGPVWTRGEFFEGFAIIGMLWEVSTEMWSRFICSEIDQEVDQIHVTAQVEFFSQPIPTGFYSSNGGIGNGADVLGRKIHLQINA